MLSSDLQPSLNIFRTFLPGPATFNPVIHSGGQPQKRLGSLPVGLMEAMQEEIILIPKDIFQG